MDIQTILQGIKPYVIGWIGPAWVTYAATASGSSGSAGTYAETDALARYCVVGHICYLSIIKKVTNKGSWGGNVQILLPVTPGSSAFSVVKEYPPCWYASGSAANTAKAFARWDGSNILTFTDALQSSFFTWAELSVNDVLEISMFYEI